MQSTVTGQIKRAVPADGTKVDTFNYIQASGAGTITVRRLDGTTVLITAAILAKLDIIPVGLMDEILATGTTATDIYYW